MPDMRNYPAIFDEFTEDAAERQELQGSYVDPLEPEDPHYVEAQLLANQIAHYARTLTHTARNAAHYYLQGLSVKDTAEKLGKKPTAIYSALKKPEVAHLIGLMTRVQQIRTAPSKLSRQQMLWRIAKRTEVKQPTTAIRAVDILNRQEGDYAQEEQQINRTPTINILQFNNYEANFAPQPALQPALQPDHSPSTRPAIDGEFHKVTVNMDRPHRLHHPHQDDDD